MESISYFTEKMQTTFINSLKDRLIKSCNNYYKDQKNNNLSNFVFSYDIKNNYVFCLLTCSTGNECFTTMYRMLTVHAHMPGEDIFSDGNFASSYTLNDVKKRTFNHVKSHFNELQEIENLFN